MKWREGEAGGVGQNVDFNITARGGSLSVKVHKFGLRFDSGQLFGE